MEGKLYKVESVSFTGEQDLGEGVSIPKYYLTLIDPEGHRLEYISLLTKTEPKVGEFLNLKIDRVEKGGRVFYNAKKVRETATQKTGYKKDPEESMRILRQGFMNNAIQIFISMGMADYKEWLKYVRMLEPIYRNYIETGKLPEEENND